MTNQNPFYPNPAGQFPQPAWNSNQYPQSQMQSPVVIEQTTKVVPDFTQDLTIIEVEVDGNNNRPRIKRKEVCNAFLITTVVEVVTIGSQAKPAYLVQYSTVEGICRAVIPSADVEGEKYFKNMSGIRKLHGITTKELNDVIGCELQECRNRQRIELYPRQGFVRREDGSFIFVSLSNFPNIPESLIADSVKNRRYLRYPLQYSPFNVMSQYLGMCSGSTSMMTVGLLMLGSLTLPMLTDDIRNDMPIISIDASNVQASRIAALLSSICSVLKLSDSVKTLETELEKIWDGAAVIIDDYFADEIDKMLNKIRAILRSRKSGRKLIAVISDKFGMLANNIEADSCVSISIEDNCLQQPVGEIQMISTAAEAVMINIAGGFLNTARAEDIRRNPTYSNDNGSDVPTCISSLACLLAGTVGLLNAGLECEIIDAAALDKICELLENSNCPGRSPDDIITTSFGQALSEALCSGN